MCSILPGSPVPSCSDWVKCSPPPSGYLFVMLETKTEFYAHRRSPSLRIWKWASVRRLISANSGSERLRKTGHPAYEQYLFPLPSVTPISCSCLSSSCLIVDPLSLTPLCAPLPESSVHHRHLHRRRHCSERPCCRLLGTRRLPTNPLRPLPVAWAHSSGPRLQSSFLAQHPTSARTAGIYLLPCPTRSLGALLNARTHHIPSFLLLAIGDGTIIGQQPAWPWKEIHICPLRLDEGLG